MEMRLGLLLKEAPRIQSGKPVLDQCNHWRESKSKASLQRALLQRHSFTAESHFAANIMAIVSNQKSPQVILSIYQATVADKVDSCEQFVVDLVDSFFRFEDAFNKLVQLVEYYKFHIEVPRLFAYFIGSKASRYHQSKRNILYQKICGRLQDESSKLG